MDIKKIGDVEYYIGRFKNPDTNEIKYGVHARDIITKEALFAAVSLGLFDTAEAAENAWIDRMKKQSKE